MMEKQKVSIAQYFTIKISTKLCLKTLFGFPRHQIEYRLGGMHQWKEYVLMVSLKILKHNKKYGYLILILITEVTRQEKNLQI